MSQGDPGNFSGRAPRNRGRFSGAKRASAFFWKFFVVILTVLVTVYTLNLHHFYTFKNKTSHSFWGHSPPDSLLQRSSTKLASLSLCPPFSKVKICPCLGILLFCHYCQSSSECYVRLFTKVMSLTALLEIVFPLICLHIIGCFLLLVAIVFA